MKKVDKTTVSDIFFNKDLFDIQKKSEKRMRQNYLKNDYKNELFSKKLENSYKRIDAFLLECKKVNKIPEISFSGGKDSCVISYLVRKRNKKIKCVVAAEIFHPENYKLIKNHENTEIFPAIKTFENVVKEYGFPIISKEVSQRIHALRNCKTLGKWVKAILGLGTIRPIPKKYLHIVDTDFNPYVEASHMCCHFIKGNVKKSNSPKFVGTTIDESKLRRSSWIKEGCIFISEKTMICRPISVWTEKEVINFLRKKKIPYSKAYDMGWKRTGCISCGFGMNIESQIKKRDPKYKTRFDLLKEKYPQRFNHYMFKVGMANALAMAGVEGIDDPKYQEIFMKQNDKNKDWYDSKNIEKNVLKILEQIEKRTNGKFTKLEKEKILERYVK